MTMPCTPLTATPNSTATMQAPTMASARLDRKTSAAAERVTPSDSDMMFPVRVMKVMPTATQPMKEIAVISAERLKGEMKPGVAIDQIASAAKAKRRIA